MRNHPLEQRIQIEALRAVIALAEHSPIVSRCIDQTYIPSIRQPHEEETRGAYITTLKKSCR